MSLVESQLQRVPAVVTELHRTFATVVTRVQESVQDSKRGCNRELMTRLIAAQGGITDDQRTEFALELREKAHRLEMGDTHGPIRTALESLIHIHPTEEPITIIAAKSLSIQNMTPSQADEQISKRNQEWCEKHKIPVPHHNF